LYKNRELGICRDTEIWGLEILRVFVQNKELEIERTEGVSRDKES
jgi:hypothetical protein